MNFTLCVLLVYNDNGSVQTLFAKCLHRPIVIINQQYTKGEIHFINISQGTKGTHSFFVFAYAKALGLLQLRKRPLLYGPYSHLFNHVLETFTVSLYSTEMNTRRSYDWHVWSLCLRFATSTTRQASSWFVNLGHLFGFPRPSRNMGTDSMKKT